jgi:hypothetical protein
VKLQEVKVPHTLGGASYKQKVYYESIKREVKTRPIYECRCDERLKTKTESSVMGEYVFKDAVLTVLI